MKLSSSIPDPSNASQVDGTILTEFSLSQMEEFARKNSVSLIKKLEEMVGADQVKDEKKFLKSMELKENWLLNWRKAKYFSTNLDKVQDVNWELVKKLLFKKVSESREENEQETEDEERAVSDKQTTNDQSSNSNVESGVSSGTTYTQDVQNDVDSGQGSKQHTHTEQEEQPTESPAGNKKARKYKDEAQENERKAKKLKKWLEREVDKASNTQNSGKEEIRTKIKSNIEFINTWEHKTYRCLVAHDCILYTCISTGEKRLIELEKSASKCLNTKGECAESRFKWQYYMWMFGGIKKIDVVFCDRDSDEFHSYKYDENWFKNFHTKFPEFLDKQVLPVIALYKEAQKENNFRFLESEEVAPLKPPLK